MGMGAKIMPHIKLGMQPFVDLVYPPRCPACGDQVTQQGGLCLDCWSGITVPSSDSDLDGSAVDWEQGVVAAARYDDISRRLILTFKHGGKISLATLLGQMLASRMPPIDTQDPPLLIPVPLHRVRLWQRGFNQAALLARELSRHGHGDLLVDGLVRKQRTPSLGGLGKHERRAALKGAITARSSKTKTIAGRRVVLVDDVFTSGATSDACVKALRSAGARSVLVACFAKVEG